MITLGQFKNYCAYVLKHYGDESKFKSVTKRYLEPGLVLWQKSGPGKMSLGVLSFDVNQEIRWHCQRRNRYVCGWKAIETFEDTLGESIQEEMGLEFLLEAQ